MPGNIVAVTQTIALASVAALLSGKFHACLYSCWYPSEASIDILQGYTALMETALSGQFEVAKLLVDAGADFHASNMQVSLQQYLCSLGISSLQAPCCRVPPY